MTSHHTATSAVILIPEYPTFEMIMLLRSPELILTLTYLEGSALVDKDLSRAKVDIADAVFIMSDKFSHFPDEEDAKSILQNLSIKRFLSYQIKENASLMYCMQLIRPENRKHIDVDGAQAMEHAMQTDEHSVVVCINEIKMGIMAKALIYPGSNTLIMNLITSFAEVTDTSESDGDGWLAEYQKGCDWEIYVTDLSDKFIGSRFCDLSWALYEKLGVVLFALQVFDMRNNNASKLFINPANFIIPTKIRYRVEAFVIAKNKAESDLSFQQNAMSKGWGEFMQWEEQMVRGGAHALTDVVSTIHQKSTSEIIPTQKPAVSSSLPVPAKPTFSSVSKPRVASLGDKQSMATAHSTGNKESLWKRLKRSAMIEKKIENNSIQEIMQDIEFKHFNEQVSD